jgi:hypothetical protein
VNDAVERLLQSAEPAIRRLAHRDLLGRESADDVLSGRLVQSLLVDHGVHPYGKWRGAHWRLVSLVELGITAREPRAVAAAETVLAWLTGRGHRGNIPTIAGRVRRCASQEGNALAVCARLGLATDPRVELLARSLVEWQWPDGGWNCDRRPAAHRSSFHESLAPMWGLHEYGEATGASWARDAAERAAELFLSHRLFRTVRNGEVIEEDWLVPHYPPFWHYDVPQALLLLRRMGLHDDPRADRALEVLATGRGEDGLWPARRTWWRPPGSNGGNVEAVDWGEHAREMVTLNALRVLHS